MAQLKDARRAANLTQKQLAAAATVDQRTISRLENGRVKKASYRDVILICRALDVDPEQIDEFKVGGTR